MHLAPQNYLYPHEMKKKTFRLIRRGELNERGKDLKAYYHPPCEGGQGDVPLDGGNTSNGYSLRMLHPPTPFLRGIRIVHPILIVIQTTVGRKNLKSVLSSPFTRGIITA